MRTRTTNIRVITVSSPKGGVGKTTLSANLAGVLAGMDHRVLLIDCDPQASLSSYYDIQMPVAGITHVIRQAEITPDTVTSITDFPNLSVVVCNANAKELSDLLLFQTMNGRVRLRKAIDKLKDFDYVIIDTQGAEGAIQDVGVLAADMLLIPVRPDKMSVQSALTGVNKLQSRFNEDPSEPWAQMPMRVIVNEVDRTKNSRAIEAYIRENFRDGTGQLETLITVAPHAKAYPEATTLGIPVHIHEPKRSGKMPAASKVIHDLVWELLPNLKGHVAGS